MVSRSEGGGLDTADLYFRTSEITRGRDGAEVRVGGGDHDVVLALAGRGRGAVRWKTPYERHGAVAGSGTQLRDREAGWCRRDRGGRTSSSSDFQVQTFKFRSVLVNQGGGGWGRGEERGYVVQRGGRWRGEGWRGGRGGRMLKGDETQGVPPLFHAVDETR